MMLIFLNYSVYLSSWCKWCKLSDVDKSEVMEQSQYSFAKKLYLTIALIIQRRQYKCIHMTETKTGYL